MLQDVQADSANMIVEIREYLDFISTFNPSPPKAVPRHINTAKGLVYVQLYGAIEYSVLKTISKTINYINSENTNLSNLKPCIYSLILNDELNSLIDVRSKKWDKRHILFDKIRLDEIASINDSLTPTDGKNIGAPQLNSIWKIFGLDVPVFTDLAFIDRLKDIVTNRINIAHGNLTPSEIGKNVTISDLYLRIKDVSAYCSYITSCFEVYLQNRQYLK